jgi:hypothetical protein
MGCDTASLFIVTAIFFVTTVVMCLNNLISCLLSICSSRIASPGSIQNNTYHVTTVILFRVDKEVASV